MTMKDSICECCNKNQPLVGVACIPGLPMSIAWCRECLEAGIIPYWALVNQTASANGLENCDEWWKELVTQTLKYFEKTIECFNEDVVKEMEMFK